MSVKGYRRPHIVVLGAGLGGTLAAYEIEAALRGRAELQVISDSKFFSFVPSNPWVAVHWREASAIRVDLTPIFARKKIAFTTVGAQRLRPDINQVELRDGTTIAYDYLVIATGPDLAFDEIEGLGPEGHTVSVCRTDHASTAAEAFDRLVANPGPVVIGAAQGASCFGPAYEFAMILDTELRRRRIRNQVPMTFVTPEPYIGHLGLDGVGDTKSMLEGELRDRHTKWITNARIARVEPAKMHIEELREDATIKAMHELPFSFSMVLPAFRGVPAVRGVEGLTNARGFVVVDEYQRNPAFPNVFALGVCIAIPPVGQTPVPVGVPKTGFMIESMVTAIAQNLSALIDDRPVTSVPTWNAVCLADFGDGGVAFVAQPQIPPRNLNWSSEGKWVHAAKVAFEKYFLHKIRKGRSEPFYEKLALETMGIRRLRDSSTAKAAV